MKKIGITGSLASGKTSASKFLSYKKGPLFSADVIVKNLYTKSSFKKLIKKKLNIKKTQNLKKTLKKKILIDKNYLKNLEIIIHPLVRKEMLKFAKKNVKKKFVFFEIPLLVENKLMKKFDVIFFIKSKKSSRLKRFIKKGGNKDLFQMLNNKQLNDKNKIKYCDHTVLNDKSLKALKKKLLNIFRKYE